MVSEATYARTKKKTIIPLKFDDYEPSDWLGLIMGSKLYYKVHTDEVLEEVFPNLVRELGAKGRTNEKR